VGVYDQEDIHRIRTGGEADRLAATPLEGELIATMDGSSPVLYLGDGSTSGGFFVGPLGGFFAVEKLSTDCGPVTAIPWTAHPVQTEEFGHDTGVNPSEVSFLAGGLFLVSCSITVTFSATTFFTLQIQRDQSSGTWKNINGGGTITSGVAGDIRTATASCMYAFPPTEKLRVVGSNGLLTTTNTVLVANYCSIEITRIR